MAAIYTPLAEKSLDTTGEIVAVQKGGRISLKIQARSTNTAAVKIFFLASGASAKGTSDSYLELAAGGLFDPPADQVPSNAIWVQAASGTQVISWTEA